MLSILIPTYNYDVNALTKELFHQALNQYIEFEIIVLEDGSSSEFIERNKNISTLKNCKHIVLKNNIGRSAARNKLADEAQYEHLLFIDCDAEVHSKDFIKKYLPFCKEECIVIGGTSYELNNHNPKYSLRLKYGRKREARSANKRKKNNFSSFNFLISKHIFNQIRFNDKIRGYGYEDMLFGYQLHQLGYIVIQIENPLIHKGLDDNKTFLQKTEEGMLNLFLLFTSGYYPSLPEESKLLAAFLRIKKYHILSFFVFVFKITNKMISRLLCLSSPSLVLFDFYKLLFLCNISVSENKKKHEIF